MSRYSNLSNNLLQLPISAFCILGDVADTVSKSGGRHRSVFLVCTFFSSPKNPSTPPDELLHHFEQIAMPFLRHRLVLNDANANLRTTRDFLLPKLVSGEIEISDAEIILEGATV